jgi:ribose 5-phosphate isomerase RpiB
MKIVVINETSAADRNADILAALQGRGHEVVNAGMTRSGVTPELTYIHTGFLSALLLNAGRADLVVGGCGTGQGYLNSVMQYPGVTCGHLLSPLDAWLFAQINDGNCMALMLNQGYGWGADVNLRMLFDAYFSVPRGGGYPPHRRDSQAQSRALLKSISEIGRRPMDQIVENLDERIVKPALNFPGVWELLALDTLTDTALAEALRRRR